MRKQGYILAFIIISLLSSYVCLAQQSKIDSLLSLLKTDKEDTSKVKHLNSISWGYDGLGAYDSSFFFANNALKLAQQLNPPYQKGIASAYGNIGNFYSGQ